MELSCVAEPSATTHDLGSGDPEVPRSSERVIVAGATGFAGALAAHLLWRHPRFELVAVTGRSEVGTRLDELAMARVIRSACGDAGVEPVMEVPAGVEVVSLDEVEASEEKAAEPVVDDIDVEEDDAEAPDDPFLEEEEEDDDDVTNLIDGDIAPDEET